MEMEPARSYGESRATFLFAIPSWIDGFASIFDMSGQTHIKYATSSSAAAADQRALRQDWLAVGDSLRGALSTSPQDLAAK